MNRPTSGVPGERAPRKNHRRIFGVFAWFLQLALGCGVVDELEWSPAIDAAQPADVPDRLKDRRSRLETEVARLGLYRRSDGSYEAFKGEDLFATVHADGRVTFAASSTPRSRSRTEGGGIPLAGAMDWMTRSGRGDHDIPERKAFLDRTRDFRVTLAEDWSRSRSVVEFELLDRHLRSLWNDTHVSTKRKRELLFRLWDECEENVGAVAEDAGQYQRVEAAMRARARIVAFARAHAPAGTSLAYTPAELEHLNASRASRAVFDPYGDDSR